MILEEASLIKLIRQYISVKACQLDNRWLLDHEVLDESRSLYKAVLCTRLYQDIEGESSLVSSTRGEEDAIRS